MHRLRFAILGAVAALALGTASAVAMQQGATGGTDPDQHGDNVASAARHCPHGPGGVHGKCVSAVASSKSEGQENEGQNEAQEDARDAAVDACKAADKAEDKSEKKPAKGDKAAKAADKTEDKNERAAFKACLQAAGVSAESSK